ncbi:MAG: L-histidine N(alpha)-methyltransferase [Bryobacteraceae bacterium]
MIAGDAPTLLSEQSDIAEFARDVRLGLGRIGQKELASTWLYDEVGSALFEAITYLPEYGLTRADERLLRDHASSIAGLLPESTLVAELGSGSGRKTKHVLQALSNGRRVVYYPIDVSPSALNSCRQDLASTATIIAIKNSYLDGLRQVAALRHPAQTLLVLFLGSTLGNFDPSGALQFLQGVRRVLREGDFLLLGTDLVKPVDRMILAYDDPPGVTAAFNLNLLARINRELDADFDLREFRHQAIYNEDERRIEMHLVSLCRQSVRIPGAGLLVSLSPRETIWTESSHKFQQEELEELAFKAGFRQKAQWIDSEWPFAESLWTACSKRPE